METNALNPGITRLRAGKEWHVLGQTYWLLAHSGTTFAFETHCPPGTFVPPHIHPNQDEFIYVVEGELDLLLDGEEHQASAGDLVRMPRGIPHGFFNNAEVAARAIFWVSPAGKLKALFDNLHELEDVDEVVRLSAQHDVEFLPPEA